MTECRNETWNGIKVTASVHKLAEMLDAPFKTESVTCAAAGVVHILDELTPEDQRRVIAVVQTVRPRRISY